jgi:hypothetical protein
MAREEHRPILVMNKALKRIAGSGREGPARWAALRNAKRYNLYSSKNIIIGIK